MVLRYFSDCVLCDGGDDRIGIYGGADQFQGLLYLQRGDQPRRLSDLRTLDLGRRMAFITEFP